MIILTNASSEHLDKPVAIKEDLIVSVFKSTVKVEGEDDREVTFVFAPPHGTWEVKESVEEVVKLING
jgi:Icc-related predicted phosphoesterase